MGSSLSTEPGESKYQSFKRREETWGIAPEIVRYFHPGLPQPQATFDNAKIVTSFKLPFINGKPDVMGVLNGVYDNAFRTFFNSLQGTVWWSLWHEVEDDIEDGIISFAQWKSCFERVYRISQEYNGVNGRDLRVGVILMGWTADSRSGRKPANYTQTFPLDFVGWDVYPTVSKTDTDFRFTQCYNAARDVFGVTDVMVTETGINNIGNTEPAKSEWITYGVAKALELGYTGFIYYDAVDPGNSSWDSRLLTEQQHQAMHNAIVNY